MESKIILACSEVELIKLIRQSVREEIKSIILEFELPSNKEPPKLMKISEVAKLLNVCVATVHTYKRKKLIPFKKIGRSLYFEQEKVLQAMREFNNKN